MLALAVFFETSRTEILAAFCKRLIQDCSHQDIFPYVEELISLESRAELKKIARALDAKGLNEVEKEILSKLPPKIALNPILSKFISSFQ